MTTEFEQKIAEIVGSLTTADFSYVYASKREANNILDRTKLPCVVNVLPVSGGGKITGNSVKTNANCLIGFFDKLPGVDNTSDATTEINSRMLTAINEFIARANKSGYFELITEWSWSNTEEYDAILAGVVLEIQLKQKVGVALCKLTE